MSKVKFNFLTSEYENDETNGVFVARNNAKIFRYEEEKEDLTLCCFPTHRHFVSVKGAKHISGTVAEYEEGSKWPFKESVNLEMSNDNWNAVKTVADICGFDYEILG